MPASLLCHTSVGSCRHSSELSHRSLWNLALCRPALPRPHCAAAPSPQALEKALLKYNQLLISRHSKMNEVATLHTQNNELKALLNQYLASRVNEDLICPPTQTIRLDEFASFQNTGPMG